MAEDDKEEEEQQRRVMQQAAVREREREEEHHRRRQEEREAQQAAAKNLAEQQESDDEEDDDEEAQEQEQSLEEQLQARNQQSRNDLEERVRGARTNSSSTHTLYEAQNNLEAQTTQDLYNALEETRAYVAQQGGVTDEQYEALNIFEEEINRRAGYAQERPVNAVEEIKNLGRLRLGDDYIN